MAEKPNHDSNCAKTRKTNSRPERVTLLKRRRPKAHEEDSEKYLPKKRG
jgi:hypothetical protein